MYQATLSLQLDSECVLTQLADRYNKSIDVEIEELHDEKVTFILEAGEHIDEFIEEFERSDKVHYVEAIDDQNLVITKDSCGAYPAIYKNHAVLRRHNKIGKHERIYQIIFFSRDSLKDIVSDFRTLGQVTLSEVTEFGDSKSDLTERQRKVVQQALDSGYFDWPRETDSEELAAELDISRATFLEHLRKAEEKLLRDALDDSLSSDTSPQA